MAVDRAYRYQRSWRNHRLVLLAAQGGRCLTCGAEDGEGHRLQQAHIVPAGPGVPNDPSNVLGLLCANCHRKLDSARRPKRKASR
jgi:hypothetical protein